jgi:hypothetical protein
MEGLRDDQLDLMTGDNGEPSITLGLSGGNPKAESTLRKVLVGENPQAHCSGRGINPFRAKCSSV